MKASSELHHRFFRAHHLLVDHRLIGCPHLSDRHQNVNYD
jgi:hypothetical protein